MRGRGAGEDETVEGTLVEGKGVGTHFEGEVDILWKRVFDGGLGGWLVEFDVCLRCVYGMTVGFQGSRQELIRVLV